MLLYKYERVKGPKYKIPGYEEMEGDGYEIYLNGDTVFSEWSEETAKAKGRVQSILDDLYYEYQSENRKQCNFDCSTFISSVVIPECKAGLGLFEKSSTTSKELRRLDIDKQVFLGMDFKKDEKNSIWTNAIVVEDGNVLEGFVLYKTFRNNFANLLIQGISYNTILTNGEIDPEKIKLINEKNTNVSIGYKARMSTRSSTKETKKGTVTIQGTNTMYKGDNGRNVDVKVEAVLKEKQKNSKPKKNTTTSAFTSAVKNLIDTASKQVADKIVQKQDLNGVAQSGSGVYPHSNCCNSGNFASFYKHENIDIRSIADLSHKNLNGYNRFKLAYPDDTLDRGFMHVFFTRPDLNIYNGTTLTTQCRNDPIFYDRFSTKPDIIRQLSHNTSYASDFMWLLSNKASDFSLIDTTIEADQYGKSFLGYEIPFARKKEGEAGGTFQITYQDTRDLDVLVLHELWIEYMNNVYSGRWNPKFKYVWQKIIDYACSVYVIITAEDFETILFWTKFYGVFPINVPYSALSWTSGQPISKPSLSITYRYAWKEDFNSAALTDLNTNTFKKGNGGTKEYILSYDPNVGHAGYSWVGAPFVETIKYLTGNPTNGSFLTRKLRFRKN